MAEAVRTDPVQLRAALLFVLIGVIIYGLVYSAAEALVWRNGHVNPFFKIMTANANRYDWVILGASHAMPLDFEDTEKQIEAATGQNIINLALQGAGPLYNRLVLEHFLEEHSTQAILYVADSFAFRSRLWNEDRISDAKLLARTPFTRPLTARLTDYVMTEGVDWHALPNYVLGFSKINDRERFAPDTWDAESQFTRRYRPSAQAEDDRIAYLFPAGSDDPVTLQRYLGEFDDLLAVAAEHGIAVVVIKMPVPKRYYAKLPGEAEFDFALKAQLAQHSLALRDYSLSLDGAQYYFDSDHLGKAGIEVFLPEVLIPLLMRPQQL